MSDTDSGWATGRLRATNDSNYIYGSGNIISTGFAPTDTAFRPIFVATFIPEPASLALLGIGGLLMLRRRKK